MKWKYTLKCGKAIHEAIRDEDCKKVMELLVTAYKELTTAKLIDDYDFERYTDDFELYGDDLNEEDVDYELSEFYDLCDALGVLIYV